jgi:hypothetical protein
MRRGTFARQLKRLAAPLKAVVALRICIVNYQAGSAEAVGTLFQTDGRFTVR